MGGPPIRHRPGAQARRDALLEAAVLTIAESGIAGATHRAVAARAGLPASTTSYFFASIDALVLEALDTVVTDVLARQRDLRDVLTRGAPALDEAIELAVDIALRPSHRDLLVQFDAYLEGARRPELREGVRRALEAYEDTATEVLAALGVARPVPAARAFVALLDGFALHRVARPRAGEDREALRDAIRALFVGFSVGDEPPAGDR